MTAPRGRGRPSYLLRISISNLGEREAALFKNRTSPGWGTLASENKLHKCLRALHGRAIHFTFVREQPSFG
eukprot:2642004-Pyramimonas_sp.AAC.4